MSTITDRVAAGAAFLDEHDPDWWRADVDRAIDLDMLLLSATDLCVLGQRCPLNVLAGRCELPVDELSAIDFGEAYDAYARQLSGLSEHKLAYWARDYGFTLTSDLDGHDDWDDLTAEWKRVITARRAAS